MYFYKKNLVITSFELRFSAFKKNKIRYSNRLFDDKSEISSNKYNSQWKCPQKLEGDFLYYDISI
ncbi:hypothetical protein RhiirA4_484825 [Rhizophagus irregularis]|uniref:Uncharacterized protein n=1 Tax=Rhizophagus irregularis TaxID=588596 RepID=A0A2I1HPE1_9GLOM|nr:hypothetical protein RhiirA4_484825 [Rhizophagus irregularis]